MGKKVFNRYVLGNLITLLKQQIAKCFYFVHVPGYMHGLLNRLAGKGKLCHYKIHLSIWKRFRKCKSSDLQDAITFKMSFQKDIYTMQLISAKCDLITKFSATYEIYFRRLSHFPKVLQLSLVSEKILKPESSQGNEPKHSGKFIFWREDKITMALRPVGTRKYTGKNNGRM